MTDSLVALAAVYVKTTFFCCGSTNALGLRLQRRIFWSVINRKDLSGVDQQLYFCCVKVAGVDKILLLRPAANDNVHPSSINWSILTLMVWESGRNRPQIAVWSLSCSKVAACALSVCFRRYGNISRILLFICPKTASAWRRPRRGWRRLLGREFRRPCPA